MNFIRYAFITLWLAAPTAQLAAQTLPHVAAEAATDAQATDPKDQESKKAKRGDVLDDTPDTYTQVEQLQHALVRLPIAAAFATVLALRPRRRGTPPRQAPVIQTQIILAV